MVDFWFVTSGGREGPLIPDYFGPNVRGIMPALLGPGGWSRDLPPWIPAVVADAERVVLLVLDGLGWHQFADHAHLMPNLSALDGGPIHTVAPTTTATALCSITTGLTPGEHGLIGYRIAVRGEVLNVLRWSVGERHARRTHVPTVFQPFPPFLGQAVPVVSPAELQDSAFSEAHLRGGVPAGWRAASSIPVAAREQCLAGHRVVYCYYGAIDKIAHERGFGPYYESELRFADQLVGAMLETLPAGTALLITADHGQVDVGERTIAPSAELLRHVTLQSGEGRFRWLHCRSAAVEELRAAAEAEFGDVAWVVTRDQTLDEGWFGPSVAPQVQARLGDVALVARDVVSFHDPDDSGPFSLVCRHGSLTPAEVEVPLLARGV